MMQQYNFSTPDPADRSPTLYGGKDAVEGRIGDGKVKGGGKDKEKDRELGSEVQKILKIDPDERLYHFKRMTLYAGNSTTVYTNCRQGADNLHPSW